MEIKNTALVDRLLKIVIEIVNNSFCRSCKRYSNNIELILPEMKYCTDNGAMIGAAAYYAYQKGDIADLSLNADAGLRL